MSINKLIKTIIMTVALVVFSLPAFAATLSGKITFEGDAPQFKAIKMDADPICLTSNHGKSVYPEMLVMGDNHELANVFVYIKEGLPASNYPAPTEEVIVDQQGCTYSPHIIGVMKGQPVKILNPDGTLHNVHSTSKINEEFNIAMPKFRKDITKVFDKAEFMFTLKCDVHPWMKAYISVMDNPFFAISGTDGMYSIENLPAGTYTIEAWHEKLPAQTMKITIAEGENKEVAFAFTKPSK